MSEVRQQIARERERESGKKQDRDSVKKKQRQVATTKCGKSLTRGPASCWLSESCLQAVASR